MRCMKCADRFLLALLLAAVLLQPWSLRAADSAGAVVRPPIVGVAHIGLNTDDMAAARKFYTGILGFQEPFSLDKPDGSGLMLTYFKVNDHQYIEVFPDLKDPGQLRLNHICFETTKVEQLRAYLASKGVTVPDKVATGLDGNLSFEIRDPEDHLVEFVQYMPGSLHSRNFGKFLPSTRISEHIIHVGFVVKDRAAEDRFYKDILGFRFFWQGGMTDTRADWVDMRVPDGTDWLEYMMNLRDETPHTLGVMNHLALGVPSTQAGFETVVSRGLNPEKPKIGRDGKWQLNLYDPNLTRVELMEPKPVEKPCCSPMLP
jgi:catechol 2,3-dioxygenase-like lactoylglutathione lyase family enzyme